MTKPRATTDQLRYRIDQGAGSDKVNYADPAAAPLGTDDEAAGTPNSAAQVREAMSHELRSATPTGAQTDKPPGGAAGPQRRLNEHMKTNWRLTVSAILLTIAALVAVVLVMQALG